jgi:similar to stage IV sporulation protein
VGNEKVPTEEIVETLKKNGFTTGKFRYGNDITSLQNKILLEIKDLSWMWVDIRGTRAIVEVKEKVPIPQIVDKKQPCNIVAGANGLITEINATYGQRVANVGDVVKQGTLLISGISNTRYDGIHYLHSSGEVKARTWRAKTSEMPLVKTYFSQTDKKISKNTINLFGFGVKLYLKDNVPYEYFDEETFSHKLRLGENLVLPISFERRIFRELVKIEERLSRDEALEICTNQLYTDLDSTLTEKSEVVNRKISVLNETEESITVKAEYECIEEIGVPVPILTE